MPVIVVGLLVGEIVLICLALANRTRRARPASKGQQGIPSPAAHHGPVPQGSYYAIAPPNRAKGRPMGWYSVNGNLSDERFWDGRTWTARRRLVEGTWSSVPLGG